MFRFFWWSSDVDKFFDEYVMIVYVFGVIDLLCCVNYSFKRIVEDNWDKYDFIVIDIVLRYFYVDDMLRVLKNEEIVIWVVNDLMLLFVRGGFRLIKFMLNSFIVFEVILNDERVVFFINFDLDEFLVEWVFGVGWNVKDDIFCFKVISCDKFDIMWGVLLCVLFFYDLLGFVVFVVLFVK